MDLVKLYLMCWCDIIMVLCPRQHMVILGTDTDAAAQSNTTSLQMLYMITNSRQLAFI